MADPGPPPEAGSNGFPIDNQTYTFDVGVPDAQGGAQGPWRPTVDVSDSFVDPATGRPKDLSTPTLVTLARYLSDATMGRGPATRVPNAYPVDPERQPASIVTTAGTPPAIVPPSNSAAFAPGDPNLVIQSRAFPATLGSVLKRGRQAGGSIDGNDLLAGVPGDVSYVGSPGRLAGDGSTNAAPVEGHRSTAQVVAPYVSAVLSTNRFTAAAASAPSTGQAPAAGYDPTFLRQQKLGSYDPLAQQVTAGSLAAIGPLLTMRAGLEQGASDPGADPNSAGLQAAALLPGLAQLGTSRVDVDRLTASDVLATLAAGEPDRPDIVSIGSQSWGQLNNVADPFSGTSALGMTALSVALVASMLALFDSLGVLLGAITPAVKATSRDGLGRYVPGEYLAGDKAAQSAATRGGIGGVLGAASTLNVSALLGIVPTNFPFQQALVTGINSFFNVQGGSGIGLNQLAGALSTSADSPGFNVVIARAIIRSSLTIVDALKNVGGNPVNVVSTALALVDTIRSSKLVAACNVFAALGDSVLSLPAQWVDTKVSNTQKVSSVDSLDDDLGTAVSKSRLGSGIKLAWSSNRSRANLLVPTQVLGAASLLAMDQFDPSGGAGEDGDSLVSTTVVGPDSSGRIDPDSAAAFEATLEAEYVPFYFHDVRTNEMVGFHAFLAGLTDGYSATFERGDGYGRVEPTRTYKGTERRITMSFYVVSTSMRDFNDMWIKLNKLVTMVYPQYTRGVTLQNQDRSYSFTQPFSQLIGASPLIRIRLGDLIRGNYSQFALARLFGVGNSDFTVNSQQFETATSFSQGSLDILRSIVQRDLSSPTGNTYYAAPGMYVLDQSTGSPSFSVSLGSPPGPQFSPTFDPQMCPVSGMFVLKAMSVDDLTGNVVCTVDINDDPQFAQTFATAIAKARQQFGSSGLQTVLGGSYLIPAAALVPTQQTKRRLVQQASPAASDATSFATDLADFIDPAKNAVARSFRDTYGKGLAGFIETMDFDWYDKVTWETTVPGWIAPKMCKVSISFSPIHDISPGIDHMGHNRAPVYPVARMGSPGRSFPTNAAKG